MISFRKTSHPGFTLLEILLVIAAIGILAAIVIVAINPQRQLSQVQDSVTQSGVNTLHKALDQYLIDTGAYPDGVTSQAQIICDTGSLDAEVSLVDAGIDCTDRVDLRVLVPRYLAAIPSSGNPESNTPDTDYSVVIQDTGLTVFAEQQTTDAFFVAGAPYPWTPERLGPGFWMAADRSDSFTLSGDQIVEWSDLGGLGNSATQSDDSRRPTLIESGLDQKPIVAFNGTSHFLDLPLADFEPSQFQDISFFALVRWDGLVSGNPSGIYGLLSGSTVNHFEITDSGGRLRSRLRSNDISSSGTMTTGQWMLVGFQYNSSEPLQRLFRNGVQRAQSSSSAGNFIITDRAHRLGSSHDTASNGRLFHGAMAEVVQVTSPLSDLERQKIEGYMMHKWGLEDQLSSDHPYRNSAP